MNVDAPLLVMTALLFLAIMCAAVGLMHWGF